jgi:hypothetical protein
MTMDYFGPDGRHTLAAARNMYSAVDGGLEKLKNGSRGVRTVDESEIVPIKVGSFGNLDKLLSPWVQQPRTALAQNTAMMRVF